MQSETKLRLAETELKKLQQENAKLRKRLGERSRHARRVDRAYHDALLLAQLHIGYAPTSRQFAGHASISQRRWQNAMALLKMARLHDGRTWLHHDLLTVESRLDSAKDKAVATPEAYFARLNRHGKASRYW